MKYSAVANLIKQNWAPVRADETRHWLSASDLKAAHPEALRALLVLYAECILRTPSVKLASDFAAQLIDGATRISEYSVGLADLAKFLRALTLAEYRLDSLLYHPRKLRDAAIQDYASEMGWSPDLLSHVYLWWHGSNRNRVMTADSSCSIGSE